MSDNGDTRTTIRRDGACLLIEVACLNAEKAEKAMRVLADMLAEGAAIRIKFPNVTLREDANG